VGIPYRETSKGLRNVALQDLDRSQGTEEQLIAELKAQALAGAAYFDSVRDFDSDTRQDARIGISICATKRASIQFLAA